MRDPSLPDPFEQLCLCATCGVCKERAVIPNFSDRTQLCVLADARLKSSRPVCLICCLFLLQSVHSTEVCRGSAGNLNDKGQLVHPCGIWTTFFEELGFRYWSRAVTLNNSNVDRCVVIMILCQQVPKWALFDPNSKIVPTAAVDLGSMFGNFLQDTHGQAPSMSWNCGSDLSLPVNALEIIFFSCKLFSLYPLHTIVFHRWACPVAPNSLSRSLVTGEQPISRCTAWRIPAGL